ncbi:hypothetical protein EDB86DRAFT_1014395 [Lactarius hatsudake]|nr:hypothetical protein EDB86DRAFT_1014395 [Lactarius hatsudake]
MPATYAQLIELALTEAAKEGLEQFNLKWLRQQIRAQAKKAKRRLGPRLIHFILHKLYHDAQLGYLRLQSNSRGLSIHMLAGGHHAYTHRSTIVTIGEQPLSTAKTRSDLLRENEKLRRDHLQIELELARANSPIDMEDGGDAGVVTGTPSAITERVNKAPCCTIEKQKT